MVVLEGANATIPMLTIGNNQYLQPDYLAPGNSTTVRGLFRTMKKIHKILRDLESEAELF